MVEVWWRIRGTHHVFKERMTSHAAHEIRQFILEECDFHVFHGTWGTNEQAPKR